MSTDSGRQNEMQLVLKSLINILQDGCMGFADIGEHLKDNTLKRYFLAESLKRAAFRADLENELHRAGVHDVKETGTTAGTVHRVWADLKAKLGGGDHTLLEYRRARRRRRRQSGPYDALKQDLPLPLRQLLVEQQAHILTSHTTTSAITATPSSRSSSCNE